MDLLVIGGSGLLGREITRQAWCAGMRIVATFHHRSPAVDGVDWRVLDIRRRDDVMALIARTRESTTSPAPTRSPVTISAC